MFNASRYEEFANTFAAIAAGTTPEQVNELPGSLAMLIDVLDNNGLEAITKLFDQAVNQYGWRAVCLTSLDSTRGMTLVMLRAEDMPATLTGDCLIVGSRQFRFVRTGSDNECCRYDRGPAQRSQPAEEIYERSLLDHTRRLVIAALGVLSPFAVAQPDNISVQRHLLVLQGFVRRLQGDGITMQDLLEGELVFALRQVTVLSLALGRRPSEIFALAEVAAGLD